LTALTPWRRHWHPDSSLGQNILFLCCNSILNRTVIMIQWTVIIVIVIGASTPFLPLNDQTHTTSTAAVGALLLPSWLRSNAKRRMWIRCGVEFFLPP
jgi:hypothetical protein